MGSGNLLNSLGTLVHSLVLDIFYGRTNMVLFSRCTKSKISRFVEGEEDV